MRKGTCVCFCLFSDKLLVNTDQFIAGDMPAVGAMSGKFIVSLFDRYWCLLYLPGWRVL